MEDEKITGRKRGFKVRPIGIKRQAVSELESEMYMRSELCEKYGITKKTLENWVKTVKGCVSPEVASEECTQTMRLAANEVLCGVFTIEEALERHGLESAERLRYWVGRSRRENQAMGAAMSEPSCDIAPMTRSKGKDDETEQLRHELEAARMRVAALETLIDVAERELGVKIRKKPGTKQSRK
jgi:transposase